MGRVGGDEGAGCSGGGPISMLLELTRCAKVRWKEFIVDYSYSLHASHYIPF